MRALLCPRAAWPLAALRRQPPARAREAAAACARRSFASGAEKERDADTKGITAKKSEDFSQWYTQVITRSEMIEYYDVSGCYILRPYSFSMWETIQHWLDLRIKQMGVKNAYFPCFVSKEALEAEQKHVEGFAPEVAWVTRAGSSDLAKPIAIRPTSETVMYPAFAKWIRSHRDLPMKLNQWSNVVRWEFKQPTPLLRSREFLWQEGHTAHATTEEAEEMVGKILRLYSTIYEDLLAIPVIKGDKSEGEKFAGGWKTCTLEAFIPETGRAVQAATSHHLGTNFAQIFGIQYEDAQGEKKLVSQTCWGFTTRALGIMAMVHGDDKGLVLPPRVAPIQVIIVPVLPASAKDDHEAILEYCSELEEKFQHAGVRAEVDRRKNYTAGWKYHHWEMKGVPMRIEVGPSELADGSCRIVRRDNENVMEVPFESALLSAMHELEIMHDEMLDAARIRRDKGIVEVTEWSEVIPALKQRKLVLAPWCETEESEEAIKEATRKAFASEGSEEAGALSGAMKSLCIPMDQPALGRGAFCFFTGQPAKRWALFGRSY